jgi:hypothetical protein
MELWGQVKAPIKTGRRQKVKVLYCKDLANHASPESCGGDGNIAAEALTGESVGGTLSSEITVFRVPTLCLYGEGNIDHSVIASYGRTWRSLSILACVDTSCAEIGRSERNPILKSWNRGVQPVKIPWCIEVPPLSASLEHEIGTQVSDGVVIRPPHDVSRKSDNNIVPKKQANNGEHYRLSGACGGKGVD